MGGCIWWRCKSVGEYDKETHSPIFKSYGIRDGLNNDVVMSIVEDMTKICGLRLKVDFRALTVRQNTLETLINMMVF